VSAFWVWHEASAISDAQPKAAASSFLMSSSRLRKLAQRTEFLGATCPSVSKLQREPLSRLAFLCPAG
jgi:hypothetical protein